jgi:very-short-patch-repair endonuclease
MTTVRFYNAPLSPEILAFARKLRTEQTDAEKLMWFLLRGRRLGGWKFRRQYPLEPYFLDFFCFEKTLAVELDGGQHNGPVGKEKDEKCTAFIEANGIRVLRFWNHEVLQDTYAVLQVIWDVLQEAPSAAPSPPAPLPGGEGKKA